MIQLPFFDPYSPDYYLSRDGRSLVARSHPEHLGGLQQRLSNVFINWDRLAGYQLKRLRGGLNCH